MDKENNKCYNCNMENSLYKQEVKQGGITTLIEVCASCKSSEILNVKDSR